MFTGVPQTVFHHATALAARGHRRWFDRGLSSSFALSPCGRLCAAGESGGPISVFEAHDTGLFGERVVDLPAAAFCFTPESDGLLVATTDGRLVKAPFSAVARSETRPLPFRARALVTDRQRRPILVGDGGVVRLADRERVDVLFVEPACSVAVAPKGELIIGFANGELSVFGRGDQRGPRLAGHRGAVEHIAVGTDRPLLVSTARATAGHRERALVWRLHGASLRLLQSMDTEAVAAAFVPETSQVAVMDGAGEVRLYDAPTAEPVRTLVRHRPVSRGAREHLAFLPSGRQFISTSEADGELRLSKVQSESATVVTRLEGQFWPTTGYLVANEKGSELLVETRAPHGEIGLTHWYAKTGRCGRGYGRFAARPKALLLGEVAVWLDDGELIADRDGYLPRQRYPVRGIALAGHEASRTIAVARDDGAVLLFRRAREYGPSQLELVETVEGPSPALSIDFVDKGQLLLATADGLARWTERGLSAMHGVPPLHRIRSRGGTVVGFDEEGALRAFDVDSGQERPLPGEGPAHPGVAFDREGRQVAYAVGDHLFVAGLREPRRIVAEAHLSGREALSVAFTNGGPALFVGTRDIDEDEARIELVSY